jgi:hypothetical protein
MAILHTAKSANAQKRYIGMCRVRTLIERLTIIYDLI